MSLEPLPENFDDLKMAGLQEIGGPLGLSFPPGTSKAGAREQILAKRTELAAEPTDDTDHSGDDTAEPSDEAVEVELVETLADDEPRTCPCETPEQCAADGVCAVALAQAGPAFSDHDGAPENPVQTADESDEEPAEHEPGDPIVRVASNGTWWCPICDHSQTSLFTDCQGCGAPRDGAC